MSELDILKLLQRYGEETELADFSVDELEELLAQMQESENTPMSKEEFKRRYFAYYDDVKDKTRKRQDW